MRTAFSTSTREAGDLSAGVFDLKRPHAGPGRHRHARPRQLDGARRSATSSTKFPAPTMKRRRHLPDQRPVEGHRPPARLHLRHADLPARQAGRAVRLDLPRRRHRRPRHRRRRPQRSTRKASTSRSCACAKGGTVNQTLVDIVARQRARADPGGGRPLLAGDLQRDRLPPPDRDDGRVRASTTSTALGAHVLEKSRTRLARGDPQAASRATTRSQHDGRRLRQAGRPGRHLTIGPTGIDVDFAGTSRRLGLRHQRAALLHRGLCLRSA